MYPEDFKEEKELRKSKIVEALNGADAILLSDNANLFYTSGRVFSGYTYIDASGNEIYFVRRPVGLKGDEVEYIRKPEQIPAILDKRGLPIPKSLALELDHISYNDVVRLKNVFADSEIVNGSAVMRRVRSQKTELEISMLRESAIHHREVYSRIEKVYRQGMTDIELQIEIERQLRLAGNLGQFRISGQSMEIFMGNLLCGDNADAPTPYDFAMGGAGLDPSLPVGSNGTQIKPGMSVMVDMCGNFTGYMTDMTRCFYVGSLSDLARKAHNTSIAICHELQHMAKPGTPTASMYEKAVAMAEEAGLTDYFMGHVQKAGFVGHGVGIEVNELPVLAPKSRDVLAVGNVIAIEPKFVIPSVGAVGIENTYVVTEDGLDVITDAPEDLKELY